MKYCTSSKIRKDFAVANITFASSGKYDNRENILNLLKTELSEKNIDFKMKILF